MPTLKPFDPSSSIRWLSTPHDPRERRHSYDPGWPFLLARTDSLGVIALFYRGPTADPLDWRPFSIGGGGGVGPAGPQGPKGDKGDTGNTGAQGLQGIPGTNGTNGTNGAAGAQGPKGDKGDTGDQGIQGVPGNDGADGADGAPGAPGADGVDGADGATGPAGADGADGADGAAGVTGPAGPAPAGTGFVHVTGGVLDTPHEITGDVAVGASGVATIANDAVSYAKLQNVSATDKLLGRSSGGAGDVEEIACTAAGRALIDDVDAAAQRTTLGLGSAATQASGAFAAASHTHPSGEVTGLSALATSTDAANLTGTVAAARIAAGSLSLAKLADMTTARLLGRNTAGAGVPEELTAATVKTMLAIAAGDVSGLAAVATSGSASDLGTGTLPIARIAAGAVTYAKIQDVSATDKLLGRSTAGAGVVEEIACTAAGRALIDDANAAAQRTTLGLATIAASASASDLTAGTVPAAQMPALTGDVTTTAGAVATTIGANKVTLAMLAQVATATFMGRTTAGTGTVEALTAAQATALLNTRTETLKGLMPANMGVRGSLATNKSIANTLTQVVGFTAAANTLAVGTVVRFRGMGLLTNTTSASTSVLTLRINSGSLGATIEASWSCVLGTTARTNCPFIVEGEITIISTGAGGTAWGVLVVNCNTATALALPTTMVTAAVTAITTQSNVVELTCISGAASTTWNFISATAEVVQP